MLLIASESMRGSRAVKDVVREMSLTPSFFSTPAKLADLMTGTPRRIVLLAEADIREDVASMLEAARAHSPFGLVLAANRVALRSAPRNGIADRLIELANVEWIGSDFDFERLAASARRVRRRLLKVSRQDLERAFENFEFTLRYQPKVERHEAEWITREAESLVRWRHPEHGLIGPLEFLPEIEAFDMMGRLTDFVLRKTAAQLVTWHKSGLKLNACVNLASSQLTDPDLGDRFAAVISEFGVTCDRFTFEVVEEDLADTAAPHRRAIDNLRSHGFRLCLDDFRVAAASLATFEKLPFDEIKIHASALANAKDDPVSRTVLAAVTGLAHNLGMSVCAEGVEDKDTFRFLKTIRCDKMQGFLISEAVMPHILKRVYTAERTDAEVA